MDFMERCYERDPSVISKTMKDTVFLVPVENNAVQLESVYTLEGGVAARIWELIDGRKRVGQIKEIIAEEFEAKPQRIEEDLISIFKELEKKKCIKCKNARLLRKDSF